MDRRWTYDGDQTPYAVQCGAKGNDLTTLGYVESEGLVDDEEEDDFINSALKLDGIEDINFSKADYLDTNNPFGTYVIETSFNPSNMQTAVKMINTVALKMIQTKYPESYKEHNGLDTDVLLAPMTKNNDMPI